MTQETGRWNLAAAEAMVEELARLGTPAFCMAPGARSAPLAAAAARHPRAKIHVHYDERGLAYVALGIGRATGRPACLICTSGTAAANFLPAVVEASEAGVPMLLLTADRPPERIDAGANQTIRQPGIYGAYVRWANYLPAPGPALNAPALLTALDQAFYRATAAPPGPVHINCPFDEPLLPGSDAPLAELKGVARWRDASAPYTRYAEPAPSLSAQIDWGQARRPLLVIGELRHPREQEAVQAVAGAWGCPVFPDITSGFRPGPPFEAPYDAALASEPFRNLAAPDVVVHLGGRITSKRLSLWLAGLGPRYIRVSPDPRRLDPNNIVTDRVVADLEAWAAAALGAPPPELDAGWAKEVHAAGRRAEAALDACLEAQGALTNWRIARELSRNLPPGHALFAANSLAIRDLDAAAAPWTQPRPVFANRGASGIDGNLATAAGAAAGLGTPLTGLIGDAAVLHDLNSFQLAARSVVPVTIVIVNNDGGGIFHQLPLARHRDVFETCFGAPHGRRFEDAARLFELPYEHAADGGSLRQALSRAWGPGRSSIVEVAVDRAANKTAMDAALETVRRELGG